MTSSRAIAATAATVIGAAVLLAPSAAPAAPAARAAPVRPAASAAHLVVHVHLSKTTVRIGHRLRVHYSWSDGNGYLVDTNHIGTMALKVLRNVPCKHPGAAPHPISGRGTWIYVARRAFTGAYTHRVRIPVGFNVRTGGCAAVEERTATRTVTVLPARS